MKKLVIVVVVLFLAWACDDSEYVKTRSDFSYIKVGEEQLASSEIEDFIAPYKDTINQKLNKKLSYTRNDLWANKGGKVPESPMGNLMADLVFERASAKAKQLYNKEVDFVVLNRGGQRTSIAKGDITLRNMYEMMPFENTLLIVTLSPEKMKEMLGYMANSKGHPMSRVRLSVKDKEIKDLTIGGEAYDPNRSYKVVTTDYLQHGGDRMYFFSNPVSIDSLNYLLRDAMIDYFEINDTVDVELDGRFRYEK